MSEEVEMQVIMKTRFGSHLYGTETPSSDLDLKSIYLPSVRDILRQQIRPVITTNTKSNNAHKNSKAQTMIARDLISAYKVVFGESR